MPPDSGQPSRQSGLRPLEYGEIEGRVVDEQGRGIAGSWVNLIPRDEVKLPTRPDGSFVFRHLHPGRKYLVTAQHDEFEQPEVASVSADEEFVTLVMRRRMVFHGRVVAEDGSPIGDFTVNGIEVQDWLGRFDLPLLSNGDVVSITAEAAGYERQTLEFPRRPELREIKLQRLPVVQGTAVDDNGVSMANVTVDCTRPGGFQWLPPSITDAEGHFEATTRRRDTWCSAARDPWYSNVKTVDGAFVTIHMKRLWHIRGEVQTPNGRPFYHREAWVIVKRDGSLLEVRPFHGSGLSANSEGRSTFDFMVEPGHWTVTVMTPLNRHSGGWARWYTQEVDVASEDRVIKFVVDELTD
jgi:hypothetical protein